MVDDQTIDHDFDRMLLLFDEIELLIHIADDAIDANPDETLAADFFEDALVLAFAIADDGREDHQSGAVGQARSCEAIMLDGLLADWAAAVRTMRDGRCARKADADNHKSR